MSFVNLTQARISFPEKETNQAALLKACAEMETAEHLALLEEYGYDRTRGYFISRPKPIAEMTKLQRHGIAPVGRA